MAKPSTNNVWRIQWQLENGWEAKLEFYCSDTANIVPNYVDLPEICLLDVPFKWSYDKYYYGQQSAIEFEFMFNLGAIQYTDCVYQLMNPLQNFNDFEIVFNIAKSKSIFIDFQTCNIFNLYLKFIGNDDVLPEDWRLIYRGGQKAGIENGLIEGYKYKVKTHNTNLILEEIFRMEWLQNAIFDSTYGISDFIKVTQAYYDMIWSNGTKAFVSIAGNPEDPFTAYFYYFMKEEHIAGFMGNKIIKQIAQKFYRTAIADCTGSSFTSNFNYYRQDVTGAGVADTVTLKNDRYKLILVTNKLLANVFDTDLKIFGGLFSNVVYDKFVTLNDFYKDLHQGSFQRQIYLPEEMALVYFNRASTIYGNVGQIYLDERLINKNAEPKPMVDIVNRAESSMFEVEKNDLEKREQSIVSSAISNNFQMPIIINNTPIADEEIRDGSYGQRLQCKANLIIDTFYFTYNNHICENFYFEIPQYLGTDLTSEAVMLRSHEFIRLNIGNGYDSSDFINIANVNINSSSLNVMSKAQAIQFTSGIPNILAKLFLAIFGHDYLLTIPNIETVIENGLQVSGTTTNIWWLTGTPTALSLDPEIFNKTEHTLFANYPTRFHVTKVEGNLRWDGKIKVDLLSERDV